ncbi:MAG: hypothetical protein M9928_13370 [Anaerolineae bacterium]|nr:hypothetical protein [Anaerolineae bacterium]MCO5194235.1 hypothetical protein [Anaerolineae bacterium]MCO5206020.1 hypothetical protein [Anaerolineae bacterium]
MTGSIDESKQFGPEPTDDELDEALDWLAQLAAERGAANVVPPSPPIQSVAPAIVLPDWLKRDLRRQRTATPGSAETQASAAVQRPGSPDDERLGWLDEFTAELGAPIEEPPTHQWEESAKTDQGLAQAVTRVAVLGAAETIISSSEDEDDEDEDIVEGELIVEVESAAEDDSADLIFDDEDVPLRAVDPPSATRFLEDFPEDPDEAVGWLEKMAHQDEPTSAAKAGALAAAKGIDPDDDDNADDMSAALAWVEQIVNDNTEQQTQPEPVPKPSDEVDDPLAWLEKMEQEESTIVSTLPGHKSQSQPSSESKLVESPQPEMTFSGPHSAERQQAYNAFLAGDVAGAAEQYRALLPRDDALDAVIDDLVQVTSVQPEAGPLYRVLGDAYMRRGEGARAAAAYRSAVRYK